MSEEQKVSRSPWEPIGFVLDGEDWEPGEVGFILKTDGLGVTIADLRKAAAAPELLEALHNMVALARPFFTDEPQQLALSEALRAQAKAEGRQ